MPFKDIVVEIKNMPARPRTRGANGSKGIIDACAPSLREAIEQSVAPVKSWKECRHVRMDGENALCREYISKCGREKCTRVKK
ncbi:MAG: hypothetical protein NTZ73_04165 [Candidatus Diapherotrites archaeon]|nr:hypothetical protein [Candidatus Diapherotrites archaeon]